MRDAGTGIKEPVGGAARMATAIKQAEAALGGRPLVLFSGGACGPSDANTATRGEHPIAVLNALGVKCAVVGSRDTSLGLPRLSSLASRSRFPWLASNASVRHSGEPIPGTSHSVVIEHEGVRVGIIGLLDDAQQPAGPSGVARAGMVETARALAGQVREQGAEVVVALTHARATADKQLCALVPEIDLVLGGLGAAYEVRPVPPHMTWMVRSGGALKTATLVALWTPVDGRRARVECKRVDVTSHFSPCSDVEETLRDLDDHVAEARSVVVGGDSPSSLPLLSRGGVAPLPPRCPCHPRPPPRAAPPSSPARLAQSQPSPPLIPAGTATELDVAASIVGLRETPVANLVADVWRSALDAVGGVDLVFLPAACIHGDRALSPGEITTGDVAAMLPATEDVVVILVPGASLVAAIEHSVASWPKPSRVFPVVSGLTFSFNGGKGVGRRVIASSIMVSGEQLDLQVRSVRSRTGRRAAMRSLTRLLAGPLVDGRGELPGYSR